MCIAPNEPNIVLSELRPPRKFVDTFVIKDSLIVVESDRIQKFQYPLVIQPQPVTVVKTRGRVLSSQVYEDSGSHRQYIFLILSNGHFEIKDEHLRHEDSCDIEMLDLSLEPLMISDNRFNRAYVCLDRFNVLKVNINTTSEGVRFDATNPFDCIYTTSHKIASLNCCWINDFNLGETFTMTALLREQFKKYCYLQVREEVDMIRNKWEVVYHSGNTDFSDTLPNEMLISLPDIGVALMNPRRILLLQNLPLGDDLISKQTESISYLKGPLPDNKNPDASIVPRVYRENSKDLMKLIGCTSLGHLFEFSLPLNTGDDGVKSLETDNIQLRLIKVKGWSNKPFCIVESIVRLQKSIYMLVSRSEGLVIIDFDECRVLSRVEYVCDSTLHSSSISYGATDLPRLILCGGNTGNTGFIESRYLGFGKELKISKKRTVDDTTICYIWSTKSGLWWKNENCDLFKDGILLDKNSDILLVTQTGRKISTKSSAVTTQLVIGSEDNDTVSIYHDGTVHWSNSARCVRIPNFQGSSQTYVVSSRCLPGGKCFTIVAWGTETLWIYDSRLLSMKLEGMEQVSSCLLKIVERLVYIVFADTSGHVQVFSYDGTMKAQFKICNHRLLICDIPEKNYIVVFCPETAILLNLTSNNYEAAELNIPFHLKLVTYNYNSYLTVLDNKGNFYDIDLSRALQDQPVPITRTIRCKTHIFKKFLAFDLSRRYLVTSAFASRFDEILEKYVYSVELHTYDIMIGKLVSRYDISKHYPQAFVVDMVTMKFKKRLLCGHYIDNETSYAKQLIFSKCFVVSLNFECAEDDDQKNLLLFTIDEMTGQIEFRLGLKTQFSITSLTNFFNRIILVSGESLQAYQLGYSVKENEFKLQPVSRPFKLDGFTKGCFYISQNELRERSENPKRRKPQEVQKKEAIGLFNVFKGWQQFEFVIHSSTRATTEVLSYKIDHLDFRPTVQSEYDTLSKILRELGFVTTCAVNDGDQEDSEQYAGIRKKSLQNNVTIPSKTLAVADGSDYISIVNQSNPELDQHTAADVIRFKLFDQIIGIKEIESKRNCSQTHNINSHCKTARDHFVPTFLVNTCDGGCFLISTCIDTETITRYRQKAESSIDYLNYLAAMNVSPLDLDDFAFFDERCLNERGAIDSIY